MDRHGAAASTGTVGFGPTRSAPRWRRLRALRHAIHEVVADVLESGAQVARKTEIPSRSGIVAFFGNQVLVSTVAWTAGLMAAGLVRRFFEVRGFRNLWGIAASSSRTLVSADDYRTIMSVTAYSAGLVMLILVRHLLLRIIAEFRTLRSERRRPAPVPTAAGPRGGGDGADPGLPDTARRS